MEILPPQRPDNFADKVRVYTKVPPTPEVLKEFQRLANGEEGTTHFGEDWKKEDYTAFLEEIGHS